MQLDPELQKYLAKAALNGLVGLLTMLPRGEGVEAEGLGAILRLIAQAGAIDARDLDA